MTYDHQAPYGGLVSNRLKNRSAVITGGASAWQQRNDWPTKVQKL